MNKTWLLTKVQLRGLFAPRQGGSSGRRILIIVSVALLIPYFAGVIFFYAYSMGSALLGAGSSLSPLIQLMAALAAALTLITVIYRAGLTLFARKDFDLVMSLPVPASAVAASRMLLLYLVELAFSLMVLLPTGLAYVLLAKPGLLFYPLYLLATVFSPALPLVIGSLLGAAITALTSRFKRFGNAMNTVLSLLMVLAVMLLSMSLNRMDPEAMAGGLPSLVANLGRFYPPAALLARTVCDFDLLALLLLILLSLAPFALFAWLLGSRYKAICGRLMSTSTGKKGYRRQDLKTASPLKALYRRELRRYFSFPGYVMNTAFGLLLSLIAGVALVIVGVEKLSAMTGMDMGGLLAALAPAALSMLVSMAPTTYCSISLEGKQLWILKSLPVPAAKIFAGKLLVNLSLTLPVCLVNGLLLCLALHPTLSMAPLFFLLPMAMALFSSLLGLWANLLLPKLDWSNEIMVVKQSASAFISVFGGMLLGMLLIVLSVALADAAVPVLYGACGFLLLVSLLLWLWLRHGGAKRFAALG